MRNDADWSRWQTTWPLAFRRLPHQSLNRQSGKMQTRSAKKLSNGVELLIPVNSWEINFPGLVRDSTRSINSSHHLWPGICVGICVAAVGVTCHFWRLQHNRLVTDHGQTDGKMCRLRMGPLADFDPQNISHVWIDCRSLYRKIADSDTNPSWVLSNVYN